MSRFHRMNERALVSDGTQKIMLTKFKTILIWLMLFVGTVNAQQTDLSDKEYINTEFGELLYSEASISTRLEVLELFSKETPSVLVFLHALSMGLGIEDILEAAVKYQPEKARDFAESAISLLPLLSDSHDYSYRGYELDELEIDQDSQLYSIQEVAERFFEDRQTLEPRPDWQEGEYHFLGSVSELKKLQENNTNTDWYLEKNKLKNSNRPIFVSLYESDKTILIDGDEQLISASDDETFPIVFIYNQQRERSIDQLVEQQQYARTIRGVKQAYSEDSLMLTPVPEWDLGDYHIYAEMDELDELFEIPEEDDFEAQHWQELLVEAEQYKESDSAFLIVIIADNEDDVALNSLHGQQYAIYSDPREAEEFPYVIADNGGDSDNDNMSVEALISQGLVLNRPDMIAGLNAIGVTRVPIAFYYIDDARTKPYTYGPRALRLFVTGQPTPGLPGGGGGFGPPPVSSPELPPEEELPPIPPPEELPPEEELPPVCASPPCSVQ